MKHPAVLLVIVALLSFGAGWWLRPWSSGTKPANPGSVVTLAGGGSAPKPLPNAAAGNPATATDFSSPFRSWAEVRQLTDFADTANDPLLMHEGISRVLNTSAADLEVILNQAAADTKVQSIDASQMARAVLLFRWSMMNPAAAAQFAMAHPELEETSEMAPFFVSMMARNDPAAAAAWVEKLPESERADATIELQFASALKDPRAFLEDPAHASLLEDSQGLMQRIFSRWAKQSTAEAAAWYLKLPAEQQTGDLGEGLLMPWVAQDPTAAMAWLGAIPNLEAKRSMAQKYGAQLPEQVTPDELPAMLAKLPPSLADEVMGGVIDHWTHYDDPSTKPMLRQWLKAHPDTTTGSNLAENIIRKQFEADPTAASARTFIEELPNGPVRDQAHAPLTAAWAQKDLEAASSWVTSLPDGSPARDVAAQSLVHEISEDDPEGALVWALNIHDSDRQKDTLKDLFKEWLPSDPKAAVKALETLPEPMRERLGYKQISGLNWKATSPNAPLQTDSPDPPLPATRYQTPCHDPHSCG